MFKVSDDPPYKDLSEHSPVQCDGDEASDPMTASYSEISFNPENVSTNTESGAENDVTINKRPINLCDQNSVLNSEGMFHQEGDMTHFVAENLEHKIKLASPIVKPNDSLSLNELVSQPSSLYRPFHQINGDILNDLEMETQKIATSIDTLTENLCGILHSISSITADNVNTYKNAVIKMTDAMDANIKGMYTLVAKAEEVSQVMKPVNAHAARIKEIKRLVDLFDNTL